MHNFCEAVNTSSVPILKKCKAHYILITLVAAHIYRVITRDLCIVMSRQAPN